MPIRKIASFVYALSCVLLASSCRDPGPFDPLAKVAGSYTLASANGQLPLRYFHTDMNGQTTVDLTSGTLVLTNRGTFEEIIQYHLTPATGAPYDLPAQVDGTYRLDKSNITFTYLSTNGPYSWTGVVGEGTVTYHDPAFVDAGGLDAVYTK